jgi:hypothetical protein
MSQFRYQQPRSIVVGASMVDLDTYTRDDDGSFKFNLGQDKYLGIKEDQYEATKTRRIVIGALLGAGLLYGAQKLKVVKK